MHDELSTENDRVRAHSAAAVNAKIDARTRAELEAHAASPDGIRLRLAEIDREWSVDRALMANFAIVGGAMFFLGAHKGRTRWRNNGWLWFFSTQLGFLLYHAVYGWCPPAPVFRRLGFRTGKEICAERQALLHRLESAAPARSSAGA